ncbi:MAG: hydantoinase subunit beta [Chloroflexi bacterium 13_1_20CM_2_59_7]|nr:MAG: hydantoinase subunit beta [Chloroflexi bacterium 13_1_20CM_2_59_7]
MSRSSQPLSTEICRLGVDVGGTNTDAVILDAANHVLAKAKSPTTPDVSTGITNVLRKILAESGSYQSIRFAMLGTTHCTNAIATRQNLSPVGVVRLGAPATLAVPPLATWPEDLRRIVLAETCILPGGHEYNGEEISRFDQMKLREAARKMKGRVRAVAVTGVFSPVNQEHEQQARELLREELGDNTSVTLSSEIGSVGLIERENATVLNAALIEVARIAVTGFEKAMRELRIPVTLFLSQNDGTLMSIDYALQYPIFTVASGPSNSIRGAAYLSGLREAIVVDIGGTTTDIGVLQKGFPRESAMAVEIGGVRTNFRMPDLISIGLGGGSRIHQNGAVHVGPDSVGYRITEEAWVFGGAQLTATDLAVAAGYAAIGDSTRVDRLPASLVETGMAYIARQLEESIDRVKLTADPMPVVVVGGGSILFPGRIAGVSEVIRPPHYEVANALGVAIAQVSGMLDRVFSMEVMTRQQALEEATRTARERAIIAGADPASVEILEIEEIPLAYLPGNAVRIKVKAAGALRHSPAGVAAGKGSA